MDANESISSLDALVGSLVEWAETGAEIVDHMKRYAERAPVEGTRTEALASILDSVLAPLVDRHAATDLGAAAAVMCDAVDELHSQILLVDPGAFDGDGELGQ